MLTEMFTGCDFLPHQGRFRFAAHYALRHLGVCLVVALLSAALVFGLLYPAPYRAMLGVGPIFGLVLAVDVVCGPLLTLILASPLKSRRERWLDFGLIGLIQALALAYGLHSVWVARPAVLAFERDRLVVVTANEVDVADLPNAPPTLRRLPWWGVQQVGTRRTYLYDNVDAARIQGLEAGFTWAITDALRWSMDATLLRTRDKATGERLSDRPDTSVASRLAWRVAGWDAQLGAEYTGRQTSSGQRLPAYTLWNASVGRAWALGAHQRLNLRAGLENLGDLRLAEKSPAFGYAEQGRRVFVSARLDF